MLCVFACLLSNVGSKLRTIFNRNTRDWHTGRKEEDQLPTSNDITPEPHRAESTGAQSALMVSSTQSVRPSNHEGGLTSLSTMSTSLSFRVKAHCAEDPEPGGQAHSLSSRKPQGGYPGLIPRPRGSMNGSRLSLRSAGMTIASTLSA